MQKLRDTLPVINRCCVSLIFALLYAKVSTQNMQMLYDFDHLPQTLMLNPGTEVDLRCTLGCRYCQMYGLAESSSRDVSYNGLTINADGTGDILRNLQNLGFTYKSNNGVIITEM